jgi:hypothetical protein
MNAKIDQETKAEMVAFDEQAEAEADAAYISDDDSYTMLENQSPAGSKSETAANSPNNSLHTSMNKPFQLHHFEDTDVSCKFRTYSCSFPFVLLRLSEFRSQLGSLWLWSRAQKLIGKLGKQLNEQADLQIQKMGPNSLSKKSQSIRP